MTSFDAIADQLAEQAIELPSWAFGNSGTRFKVFGTPGTPRTVQEKLADAAKVHELTGLAPKVALHIPWDKVDDYAALRTYAGGPGRRAGHDQLQHLPGRPLQVRQPDPPGRVGASQGDRPPLRVHRDHEPDRVAGPEDLAGRRHQLRGPGRPPGPAGPAGRQPGADLRADRSRTSGWCWSTSSSSRRSTTWTCRTGAPRTPRWPPWGTGRRSVWTPVTTRRGPTSSSSWPSCCGSGSWARSTSTPATTPTTT